MKPRIKKKWVAALRSGEYKQGRAWLKRGDEYCCLGVLAETYLGKEVFVSSAFSEVYKLKDSNFTCSLSSKICTNVGLTNDNIGKLTYMNDMDRKSFEEIADYVEKYL